MLKPVILFTAVTSTIGTLQLFDEAFNITQGGPGDATLTLSLYIYNLSFRRAELRLCRHGVLRHH